MSQLNQFLTTQEYAKKIGVSASTVSKWLRSGKLAGQKQNGKWVIPVEETQSTSQPAPSPAPKTTAPSSPSPSPSSSDDQFLTVEKFSEMTYLTEFGVTKWLKEGRLKGIKDASGQWQVSSENLQDSSVQRLLRDR